MKSVKELYPGKSNQHIINKLRKKYDEMGKAYLQETGNKKEKCIYCKKESQFISLFKGYKEICSDNECKRKYFLDKNNQKIQRSKNSNKISIKCNVCGISDVIIQNTNKNKNKSNVCDGNFCIKNKDRPFLLEKHIIHNFNYNNLSYLNILCYNLMKKYKNNKKVRRILYKNFLLNGIDEFETYIKPRPIKDILGNDFSSARFEMTKDGLYYINLEKKDKENILKLIYGENLENYIENYYPEKFRNCSVCNEKYKFSNVFSINRKSKETCSLDCYRKNFKFYMTEERKKKQSNSIKKKIKTGEFTPNIFNSMTRKNIELQSESGIIKFRSTWEILFYVMNPGYLYENLRLEYLHEGKKKLYLVDFINHEKNIVVEVKPRSKEKEEKNLLKKESLNKWGEKNKFKVLIITEDNLKKYKYSDFEKKLKEMNYQITEDILTKIEKILENNESIKNRKNRKR